MNEKATQYVLQRGDNFIEASAVLLCDHWYPEYQISRLGDIIDPWQRPACFGFQEKEHAICEAFRVAIEGLDLGKAKMTRKKPVIGPAT